MIPPTTDTGQGGSGRPRPTDSELEILHVLWGQGPSTVRQVFEVLGARREVGYTTLLKQLQIMFEKGLTSREESGRSHIYRATLGPEDFVGDVMGRFFGGSVRELMLHALSSSPPDEKELQEMERLIAEHRERGRNGS